MNTALKALDILPRECTITSNGSGGYYCSLADKYHILAMVQAGTSKISNLRIGVQSSSSSIYFDVAECYRIGKMFYDEAIRYGMTPDSSAYLKISDRGGGIGVNIGISPTFQYSESYLLSRCQAVYGMSGIQYIMLVGFD